MAASLKGQSTIDVEFFDGNPADAFLQAVEANVTHGLPLTKEDRRAAAARIIRSHPQFSDRAIAKLVGMATRTVAAIRRSAGSVPQLAARVGRDGKVRPIDGKKGRLRAAAIMADHPEASLREVARSAGVSPATALDVRKRMAQGKGPVAADPDATDGMAAASHKPKLNASSSSVGGTGAPGGSGTVGGAGAAVAVGGSRTAGGAGEAGTVGGAQSDQDALLRKLLQDPSLRHNEQGRRLLRLLQAHVVGTRELHGLVATLPPHRVATVVQLAGQCAEMWLGFARELTERLRVIDPATNGRH